jgi:hypothetical protein
MTALSYPLQMPFFLWLRADEAGIAADPRLAPYPDFGLPLPTLLPEESISCGGEKSLVRQSRRSVAQEPASIGANATRVKRIRLNSGDGELAWAAAFVIGVAFIAWLIFAALVTAFS